VRPDPGGGQHGVHGWRRRFGIVGGILNNRSVLPFRPHRRSRIHSLWCRLTPGYHRGWPRLPTRKLLGRRKHDRNDHRQNNADNQYERDNYADRQTQCEPAALPGPLAVLGPPTDRFVIVLTVV